MTPAAHRAFGAALFVAAILALWPRVARADVVGPPPPDCVDGSEGESCHGGAFCRPRGCLGVSDCRIGERCAARDLCTLTFTCFRGSPAPAVSGPCAPSCASGSTCTSLFVCVRAAPGLDAGERPDATSGDTGTRLDARSSSDTGTGSRLHTSYCGCSVPTRTSTPGWLTGVLCALAVLGVRRRNYFVSRFE